MEILNLLAQMMDDTTAAKIKTAEKRISELRLRTGKPARICFTDGSEEAGSATGSADLHRIINRLMENSLYACERELKNGYFTTQGGARVGICGRIPDGECSIESIDAIASLCIRIPRQIRSCADLLEKHFLSEGLHSMLILSPPGCGKTTLLRELVRMASQAGYNIALCDERREIAACVNGVPQLDVGCRTDVMDGMEKSRAIPMLVRACAPHLIAADEIGCAEDARAMRDALRCGVQMLATAHASGILEAMKRRHIGPVLKEGLFRVCAVLGPAPGDINQVYIYTEEGYVDAEGNPA